MGKKNPNKKSHLKPTGSFIFTFIHSIIVKGLNFEEKFQMLKNQKLPEMSLTEVTPNIPITSKS